MAENKEKKYVIDNAQLMAEWDWDLNTDIMPDTLGQMSHKKVWWKCRQGHLWENAISKRSQGQGCPFCSGRYPVVGLTDLATTHPKLLAEWHPRNTIAPQQLTAGSGKKVWWKCANGHEWEAIVVNRTSKNRGCPYCSGRSVIAGETDLVSVNPELATEWHPTKNGDLLPSLVSPGSHKKVWWQCTMGHEWETQIKSRTSGNGCPVCANQQILVGYNDLLSKDPELAKEWHPSKNGTLTPTQILAGTDKKVWWQCEKGHEWYASVVSRHRTRCGCPVCSGESQTSFPEQAIIFYLQKLTKACNRTKVFGKEIDIYLPELKIGIEYNGAYFHKDKLQDFRKIQYFANKGIRVYSVNEGSQERICGDTIEYIYHLTKKDSLNWAIARLLELLGFSSNDIDTVSDAAEIYSQYVVQDKENSLAKKHPDIAHEWHPNKNGRLTPEQVSFGSGKKVWWQCSKGHEWEAAVYSRSAGNNCPVCAGRKLLPGFNDLETLYPHIATDWNEQKNGRIMPNQVLSGSHEKVWWKCAEGHEWEAPIIRRTSKGQGCPICAKNNASIRAKAREQRKKRSEPPCPK